VFLEWDVGTAPEDPGEGGSGYLAMYREITASMRDLIETLRGEDAD